MGMRLGMGLSVVEGSKPSGAAAPANTVAPAITGTVLTGNTLTVSDGTWTGTPAPTYTYQWKRDGVNIGGATNSTYAVTASDCGPAITCTVTATNASGSASTTSASKTFAITNIPNLTGASCGDIDGYNAATGTWTDATGNGQHATQGTAGNRPGTSAALNGHTGALSDGVDDYLVIAAHAAFGASDKVSAIVAFKDTSTAPSNILLGVPVTTRFDISVNNPVGGTIVFNNSPGPSTVYYVEDMSSPHIVSCVADRSASPGVAEFTVWQDGTAKVLSTLNGADNTGNYGTLGWNLFSFAGANGAAASMWFYFVAPRALTANERTSIEHYVGYKLGLTVA